MKRVTALFLCLALLLLAPAAHAESGASFSLSDAEIAENRLFAVTLSACSDIPLSAALFSFSYDRSLAQFRGVTAEKPFKTVSYDTGDEIRVSFLCPEGVSSVSETALFSLEFKSLQAGSFSVSFTVRECVDNRAEFMPVGTCTSGTVTISGRETARKSETQRSRSAASDNVRATAASGKSVQRSKEPTEQNSTETPLRQAGTLSEIAMRDGTMPIERVVQIFALCGAVVVMALIGLLLWRGFRSGKSSQKRE